MTEFAGDITWFLIWLILGVLTLLFAPISLAEKVVWGIVGFLAVIVMRGGDRV